KETLPALEQGEQLSRGFIGALTEPEEGGARLISLTPGGPADRAGLRVGDRIVSIDGERVGSPEALHAILDHLSGGTRARVAVVRENQPLTVDVELSDWAE